MRAQKAYETALAAAAAEKHAEVAAVRRAAEELRLAELKAARVEFDQERLIALTAAREAFDLNKSEELKAMKCAPAAAEHPLQSKHSICL